MHANITFTASSLLAREVLVTANPGIGPYDYVPTRWVCITFVTLFAISTVAHLVQATRFRIWWLFPTAILCGVSELVGWSARLYSSEVPRALVPFEIQISATITDPTPLIAVNFVILEHVIKTLGARYSRLSPRMYMILFVASDAISLTIQGAVAAMAAGNQKNPITGGNIMLAGIIMQMVAITLFVILGTEFLCRYAWNKPLKAPADDMERHQALSYELGMDKRTKIALYAMGFSTTCLFIRAVYRTIELTDGWTGRIIATQIYFSTLLRLRFGGGF